MTRYWFLLLMVVALAGCQGGERTPTVRYGEDVCANCRMIINEPQNACAIETADGEIRKYDDFNCMLLDAERVQVKKYWVQPYDKRNQWIDAQQAYYVRADDLQTPMGSRAIATESRDSAEQLARQHQGEVLDFDGLRKALLKK